MPNDFLGACQSGLPLMRLTATSTLHSEQLGNGMLNEWHVCICVPHIWDEDTFPPSSRVLNRRCWLCEGFYVFLSKKADDENMVSWLTREQFLCE